MNEGSGFYFLNVDSDPEGPLTRQDAWERYRLYVYRTGDTQTCNAYVVFAASLDEAWNIAEALWPVVRHTRSNRTTD